MTCRTKNIPGLAVPDSVWRIQVRRSQVTVVMSPDPQSILRLTSLGPGLTATEHQLEPVRGRAVGQPGVDWSYN